MYKVAQEKLNLEQQVTGGGNGIISKHMRYFFVNFIDLLICFVDDEEPDKKTMAQLLKQSLGIEDVSS